MLMAANRLATGNCLGQFSQENRHADREYRHYP